MQNVIHSDGLPLPLRYGAIATIALGITMAVLDGAIANVALPTISRELQASPSESIWIVNAYQLAIVISLLTLSYVGDILGYRRIYQWGLVLFTCTSLCCALATSLETLTLARIMQGLGGAMLMSVNTALIRIIYPQRFLGRGMAINSLVVAVATAAGPTVAAVILSFTSWKWLFLINVPFGIIALWLALRYLPDNPQKNKLQHFDVISAIMNALSFGLMLSALSGYAQGIAIKWVLLQLALLFVIGSFFIHRQLQMSVPLFPVDLLRIPLFSLSLCTSVCSFCAQMLAMVSLPFFLQNTLGRDEVATGILLTPWPLATMIVAPIAGRLIERFHSGLLGGIGLASFAGGLFLLAMLPATPTDYAIIWRMMLCGAGFGLFQSPNNHTIISSAPRNRSGGASGMLGTARMVGQTTGAALVALMFNLYRDNGTHAALLLAGMLSIVATLISLMRIKQPASL